MERRDKLLKYRRWRRRSVKIFLILLVLTTLLFVVSCISANDITVDQIIEYNNITIGETVTNSVSISHADVEARFPLISHPNYLLPQLASLDIFGVVQSISTGSVPFDYSAVSGEGVSSNGYSTAKGPGFLEVENGKFVIHDCNHTVSGYLYPYTYLLKNESGVSVYVAGHYNGTISASDIKNQNYSGTNYNITDVVDWYNDEDNDVGSKFAIDMGVTNFTDGRSSLTPQEVKDVFGEDTYKYMIQYPAGDGVCLYIPDNYVESKGPEFTTTLGDYSEYGNDLRDFNANQFCRAWNNTILPPGTSVCGREYYDFQVADDSEAPGGAAAHGVCPSARTLRECALYEGFNLPVGLSSDSDAVMYGYDPATGVWVTNNGDYPVKIVMWTEGSGVSMVIHCKFIRYLPPNYTFENSSMSSPTVGTT